MPNNDKEIEKLEKIGLETVNLLNNARNKLPNQLEKISPDTMII